MKKLFLILSVFALSIQSSLVSGASLDAYRQVVSPNQVAALQSASTARLRRTREVLDQIPRVDFSDAAYGKEVLRPNRRFSSSFFKEVVESSVKDLSMDERWGTPSIFDPSKDRNALEKELFTRRAKVIAKNFGDFDQLVDRIFVWSQKVSESRSPKEEPLEVKLKYSLNDYVGAFEPRAEGLGRLESVLGRIARVEIFQGRVVRLLFQKSQGPLIKLSLSSLVTIRTGEDPYFLQTLDYFIGRLQDEIDSLRYQKNAEGEFVFDNEGFGKVKIWNWAKEPQRKLRRLSKKEEENLKKIDSVVSVVKELSSEAQTIHHVMEKLSTEQIEFLLDLFLQLRGAEVPNDTEVQGFISYAGQIGNEFEKLNNQIVEGAKDRELTAGEKAKLQAAESKSDQVQADILFYLQTHRELQKLVDYLEWERAAVQKTKETVEKLKGDR